MAEFIQDWVYSHYQQIGLLPKAPDSFLNNALRRTSFFDPSRSSAVFVTPRNSKKILSLVRIDVDTDDQSELGVEKLLMEMGLISAPFEREVSDGYLARPEKNDFRLIHLPPGDFQFGIIRQTAVDVPLLHQRPTGGAAEILNFNLVEGSYDFLPLLYLTLDAFGLSKWSGKQTRSKTQRELVGIDRYYAHCEGDVRRKYFENLGWEVIETYPNPHFVRRGRPVPNYVLSINRADFKNSVERAFLGRDTFLEAMLLKLKLNYSQRRRASCRNLLTEHMNGSPYLGPVPRVTSQSF